MNLLSRPLLLLATMVCGLLPTNAAQSKNPSSTHPVRQLAATTAVQSFGHMSAADKTDAIIQIKAATEGVHGVVTAVTHGDPAKVLRDIGNVISAFPGPGPAIAGLSFSLLATVVSLTKPTEPDPMLVALHELKTTFRTDMTRIQSTLKEINGKVDTLLGKVDDVLDGIDAIPGKVVAELKLTDLNELKDKLAHVQRAAVQYAAGNLTSTQMANKCEDYQVASLVSELETLLKDENDLFATKFELNDLANGQAQLKLLQLYISILPLVGSCNAMQYSWESLRQDGEVMKQVIQTVYERIKWTMAPPSRQLFVRERFAPSFATAFDLDMLQPVQGFTHSMTLAVYDYMPPHGRCFKITDNGFRLESIKDLEPKAPVPANVFCVKKVETDNASLPIAYAERIDEKKKLTSIIQPEAPDAFDPLPSRGWDKDKITTFYASSVSRWTRLPVLQLVQEFEILQAKYERTTIHELTKQCEDKGPGYQRDGDGHSKDLKGGLWSIFCVKYTQRSVRDLADADTTFLVDIDWAKRNAKDAVTEDTCPKEGYRRNAGKVALPIDFIKPVVGFSTIVKESYAPCLKWERLTPGDAPKHFVKRVWLDDDHEFEDQPQLEWNEGGQAMKLGI